jgi:flagella basal body P-ring formation protein FlgA
MKPIFALLALVLPLAAVAGAVDSSQSAAVGGVADSGPPASARPAARPATALTSGALLAQVTRDVDRHFQLDGDLRLDLLQTWEPPQQAAQTWTVSVSEYPEYAGSNMFLRVRIAADGADLGEASLLVHAALWRDAWVSRMPLSSGSAFDPAELGTQRVDFFRQRDALPAASAEQGMIFCRDIAPDRVITWHDVARRPLVHKGEIVDVIGSEGMLYVTMKAMALENGARGDLVRVRNLESLKSISAEVIGDDRVEIHF